MLRSQLVCRSMGLLLLLAVQLAYAWRIETPFGEAKGDDVRVPTPGEVGNEADKVVNRIREDPSKLLVNPLGYINTTGVPTQGDFMEFVVRNPDKVVELIQNPQNIPYMPVASAIISSRNAVVAGDGKPIPASIAQFLRRWYPDDLISSVRWTTNWGPLNNLFQAAQMRFNPNTQAIVVMNAVIFRDDGSANDPVLWAHEMVHVQQYRAWGVFGFAKTWVDNSSVNGPVEGPAYARQNEAQAVVESRRAGTSMNYHVQSQQVSQPTTATYPQGFMPGYPTSQCGCWGYVQFGGTRPSSLCASGIETARPCPGMCNGGGYPWQTACQ